MINKPRRGLVTLSALCVVLVVACTSDDPFEDGADRPLIAEPSGPTIEANPSDAAPATEAVDDVGDASVTPAPVEPEAAADDGTLRDPVDDEQIPPDDLPDAPEPPVTMNRPELPEFPATTIAPADDATDARATESADDLSTTVASTDSDGDVDSGASSGGSGQPAAPEPVLTADGGQDLDDPCVQQGSSDLADAPCIPATK